MAFPRLSASMLLASLILLLYWTTSSARSHDPTSSVVSPLYRVKRDQPFENREKVDRSLAVANSFLTVVKEGFEKIDTKKLSAVMKSLADVASLAPGVGVLVASFVNMVLIFIPQDDPVLNEVKKGFAEVNRKLDSISIQIANLATDVEWFNYASVYSQDELRILNAWKKFNELLQKSQWVTNKEQKLRLAEIYVNYYENTGTEASVANLFHYLTVKDTSLSGNLNQLLRKKFKCDVQETGKYNVYFIRLLWKGMVLNQFYWKLIGLDSSGIEAKHTQMFKDVYEAQKSALEYCLTNYERYLKEDVVELSKGLSADNKQAIAVQVKEFLDKKYNWYNWVVLVYNTDKDTYHELYDMIKIPVDTITVNVGYIQKGKEISKEQVKKELDDCYQRDYNKRRLNARPPSWVTDDVTTCKKIENDMSQCSHEVSGGPIREFIKVMHASYEENFVQVPETLLTRDCLVYNKYKLFIYYSRTINDCQQSPCENGGTCKRLLDSNEHFCECRSHYHGDRCEKKIENNNIPAIDKGLTVPDITTINTKLKKILDYIRRGH
ncbi:SE-cephalotoxin-like [Sander vitreus]